MLRLLERSSGPYGPEDRAVLGRWHGWGAAPRVFDAAEHEATRAELERLIGRDGVRAAARTTLNAHYTDPEIVAALWETVEAFGVTGGTVLEPGCGSGEILAAAPAGFVGLGVELDPTTARVAGARLGAAGHEVVAADFGEIDLVAGSAAAAVGNVPFGAYAVFDEVHNPARALSIHDHFLAKSAAALAPGGIGVLITSRYTMDAGSPAGRAAIGRHADFLGAVRLPSRAHRAHAGTSVVTDIIVLRGRVEGVEAQHAPGFMEAPERFGPKDETLRVSAYWAQHPGQVVGEMTVRSGRFGPEVDVVGGDGWLDEMRAALDGVVRSAPSEVSVSSAAKPSDLFRPADQVPVPFGRIEQRPSGVFERMGHDGWEVHEPPRTQRRELSELIRLRDGAADLVMAESDGQTPDSVIESQRRAVAERYERYVEDFGPLQRRNVTETGRVTYPRMGGFRQDPGWSQVLALEVFDEDTGRSLPAAILSRRVMHAPEPVTEASSPSDALALSLHQTGRLDDLTVAGLLGIETEQVEAALGELVFRDPDLGRLVPVDEYLSGNVRRKLASAQQMAEADPARWGRNVTALEGVQPRDVTASDLSNTFGAPWVPPELMREFIADKLAGLPGQTDQLRLSRSTHTGRWDLVLSGSVSGRLKGPDHRYSIERFTALDLVESALNGSPPQVFFPKDDDGRRVPDAAGTERARDNLSELQDEFDHWLLRDDDARAAAVLGRYNEQFNAHVARDYSSYRITPPGLVESFKPHDHQHAAVARMLYGGDSLLAHPVGAGKTAEQIIGALELRRLGVIRRPLFVVPNHMLDQFSSDITKLFPAAQVLAMTPADASAKGRAAFAARVASNDWDAIVTTHSSFTRWPLSPQVEAEILTGKVEAWRADLEALKAQKANDGGHTVKGLEKRIANFEERLKETQAQIGRRQDQHAIAFDRAGVDYLVIDELHEFKNLGITTSAGIILGVPSSKGSQMAEDLDNKIQWLRSEHPDRTVVTGATGTPISNTVAEMWVMGRYINPGLLDEIGITSFDAFRQQFCDSETALEIAVEGSLRPKTRLSRYKELPELARWWGEFVDVVAVEDLGLERPEVSTGGRQVISVPPPPGLADWMDTEVVARAEAIKAGKVQPEEDNNLKLSGDMRRAAFDWEGFSGEYVDPENSALAACADKVAATYHANKDRRYPGFAGQEHPTLGAFQLVFADMGVPKAEDPASAYQRLKEMMVDRGVPADLIQFAGDHAKNGEAKERFFRQCRTGQVAVAISSTQRMGVGTNVQDRLIALHHLNAPWRPSDMEQREGRIVRQGNLNPEVELFAYVTERSSAVSDWQRLERKAGFIGQVMRADPDGPRAVEVIDDEALSYGQIKAIATGDEDFVAAAELEHEVARLERLHRAHSRNVTSATRRAGQYRRERGSHEELVEVLEPVAATITARLEARGEVPWALTVGGVEHTNRADAAREVVDSIGYQPGPLVVGTTAFGNQIQFRSGPGPREGVLELLDPEGRACGSTTRRFLDNRYDIAEMVGAFTALDGRERRIPGRVGTLRERIEELGSLIPAAETAASETFRHDPELRSKRRELAVVQKRLEERYSGPEPVPSRDPNSELRKAADRAVTSMVIAPGRNGP